MKKIILFTVLCIPFWCYSQIGINTTEPHAQLDIRSSSQANPTNIDGLLIPKIDNFPATNPGTEQNGMMVFLTTTVGSNAPGFYYWDQPTSTWLSIGNNSNFSWNLTGNTGTNSTTNFIGTSDEVDIMFRRNNLPAGRIGTSNIALGLEALASNTSGLGNTAIGEGTLSINSIGNNNTANGLGAMRNNTFGNDNTAIGKDALLANVIGNNNSAVGYSALYFNDGSFNTAIGHSALYSNREGNENTANGHHALFNNFNGAGNTAIGANVLFSNLSGSFNTGTGIETLRNNLSDNNTAYGAYALYNNQFGNNNTAIGRDVLLANTSGTFNTATGSNALSLNTSGSSNTANGAGALISNTIGVGNSAFGNFANVASGNLINASAIGSRALVGADNSMVLGSIAGVNSATNSVNVGIGTTTPLERLHIVGNIRMEDGNEDLGKVLVSDANGTATWQNAFAFAWGLTGNTGTNSTTNFIGTTDSNDFSIRTNNTQQAIVTSAGKTIFGNSVPTGDAWANFSKVVVGTNDNDNDITLRASGNDIPAINIIRSQGTMSTPLVFDSGEVGSLRFWNYTNSGPFAGYSAAGRVASIADSEGTSLLLSGAATSSHLVIRDTGQIGIGILNPQERLHVVGNIRMVDGNQALGSVLTSDANGTASWQTLSAPLLNGWSTLGNTGLNPANNFIGTTNAVDVIFRRNNLRAGRLGANNTSFGVDALSAAGNGIFNTAVGSASLQNFTNGSRNVAVGSVSLNANTTGNNNTALGVDALSFNENGNNNTAVGRRAMGNTGGVSSGSNNTAVGFFAYSTGNFSNSTALGAITAITANNQIRLGNTAVTSIGGIVGFTNLSDRRFKKNIQYDAPGLAFIKKLRPATYQLDMESMARFLGTPEESRDRNAERIRENTPETGFIAQEVEQAAREAGFTFSGVDVPQSNSDYYGLRYASFVVPLVKAVQEQQQLIETQKEEITQLKEQYRLLLQRIERLEQQ